MPTGTATLLILLAAAGAPPQGEVKLPLRDYLALIEKGEAAEQARTDALRRAEPAVADLVSQHCSIAWSEPNAEVITRFEVELRGASTQPVTLPLTGLAWKAAIRPQGSASLQRAPEGLRLVAPDVGRYEVTVWSRASVQESGGVGRMELAPMTASVGEVELSLPEGRLFRLPGAVLAEEKSRDGRRVVRLAPPRGQPVALEIRRDVQGAEADRLLARAVVVTIVDLGYDGPKRHDFVLYEVSRGEMGSLEVELPPGLELERLATDEGEAPPLLEARRLRVERTTKLQGQGYLALSSRPATLESIALDPIVPRIEVRARYLALASSIAAEVAPQPEASWLRVDLGDLPEAIRESEAGADLVAAWRLDRDAGPLGLRVTARPAAPLLDTLVRRRESLTLLTPEATLLHRDTLSVRTTESAFRLRLPPGSTLWSVRVNDMAVRPVERDGVTFVPLVSGRKGADTVEVVAVQERQLGSDRMRTRIALPEVAAPVLEHRWRLLLPEGNRYRYLAGDLLPAAAFEPPREAWARAQAAPVSRVQGIGGVSGIHGRVLDESGALIPGATVGIRHHNTGWSASVTSDGEGNFWFSSIPSGTYQLRCDLPGFVSLEYPSIQVLPGETPSFALTLRVGAVEETITVGSSAPAPLRDVEAEREAAQQAAEFREQASLLKQGLVGGVRPVPVAIPESGKVLSLAGALPPPVVEVELEVKPR